jgi:hypothetical protein
LDHDNSFDIIDDSNWGDHPTSLPFITNDFGFSTTTGWGIHDLTVSLDDSIAFTMLCICKQKAMTTDKHSHTTIALTLAGCGPHRQAWALYGKHNA